MAKLSVKVLIRLAGMVAYFRNTKFGLAKAQDEMNIATKRLIKLIKREYHLE